VTGRPNDEELAGTPSDDAVPSGSAGTDPPSDAAAASLAREVYWAGDGVSRVPSDVGSLRDRLDAFSHQLRVEQRQLVPMGETLLASAAGWKRWTKLILWRLSRFSTMRYDRLLADLAEMNRELAQRLSETEEDVSRLREDLERRSGERP
jgi:hypothetical protein